MGGGWRSWRGWRALFFFALWLCSVLLLNAVFAAPTMVRAAVSRLHTDGSPALGGCWTDEDMNRVLKRMAQRANASVFYRRMLSQWQWRQIVSREQKVRRI